MKKAIIFILAIIMVFSTVSVFATNTTNTENIKEELKDKSPLKEGTTLVEGRDVGLPDATMEDAGEWIDKKGSDVIGFLQKGSQTYMIIIFIIGAIFAATGGKKLRPTGFVMIILSVLAQAVIMYAPELMDFFQNWIAS